MKKNLNRFMFVLSVIVLASVSTIGLAADCSKETFSRFRSSAQKLSKESEQLARALLPCQEWRDETLIWLTFYLRQTGQYDRLNQLLNDLGQASQQEPNQRARLLSDAVKGKYKELESAIVNRVDSYHRDAEAVLILAPSNLNKITARAILKRLKLSADPEWLRAAQTSLIPLKDASSNDHANEFLRTVLAACRSLKE